MHQILTYRCAQAAKAHGQSSEAINEAVDLVEVISQISSRIPDSIIVSLMNDTDGYIFNLLNDWGGDSGTTIPPSTTSPLNDETIYNCGCGEKPSIETLGTCVELFCSKCGMGMSWQIRDIMELRFSKEDIDQVTYSITDYQGYEPRIQQIAREFVIEKWNAPRGREIELLGEIATLKQTLSMLEPGTITS